MKILCIQFRYSEASADAEFRSIQEKLSMDGASCGRVNALTEQVDWADPASILEGYEGVILGGSGEMYFDGGRDMDDPNRTTILAVAQRMRPFVEYLIAHEIPTLGICLGHQLIAYALGTDVYRCTDTGKTGTFTVAKTQEGVGDAIFASLPDEFTAQYGHKDVVANVPPQAVLLVAGELCRVAALRYGSSMYSTQFHPELSHSDMYERITLSPEYLPDGVELNDVLAESPYAEQVLHLFASFALSRTQNA